MYIAWGMKKLLWNGWAGTASSNLASGTPGATWTLSFLAQQQDPLRSGFTMCLFLVIFNRLDKPGVPQYNYLACIAHAWWHSPA